MDREKLIGHYIFKRICVRSWWMIVLISLIIAIYFQAAHNRATASLDLTTRLHNMENEMMDATRVFLLEINKQYPETKYLIAILTGFLGNSIKKRLLEY